MANFCIHSSSFLLSLSLGWVGLQNLFLCLWHLTLEHAAAPLPLPLHRLSLVAPSELRVANFELWAVFLERGGGGPTGAKFS